MSSYENHPNPYGQAPGAPGQPGYGATGAPVYAHWGKRVGAYLIDYLVVLVAMIPLYIGYAMMIGSAVSTASTANDPFAQQTQPQMEFSGVALLLILVGFVLGLAAFVWNTCLKGGNTGWSIGKGALGVRLLKEDTGQPMGAGMAFVRAIAHVLDSLPCYIGYLWPLWDDKRQTFADKVTGTVVVEQPKQG